MSSIWRSWLEVLSCKCIPSAPTTKHRPSHAPRNILASFCVARSLGSLYGRTVGTSAVHPIRVAAVICWPYLCIIMTNCWTNVRFKFRISTFGKVLVIKRIWYLRPRTLNNFCISLFGELQVENYIMHFFNNWCVHFWPEKVTPVKLTVYVSYVPMHAQRVA